MHPVLLRLRLSSGQLELHSFGVLVAAGCLVGILWILREARRRGLDEDAVRDLCFWTLIASLAGARVAYVATAGQELWESCLDAAKSGAGASAVLSACTRPLHVWEGGLVFYGGVAAGAVTLWAYARRHGIGTRRIADVIAPALALGHGVGRLGCFLAGCCFGKPVEAHASPLAHALGLRFPDGSIAHSDLVARGLLSPGAEHTPPLHPTQLYEAAGELVLFLLLVRVQPRLRRPGAATLAWLGVYSAFRFLVEIFRGDAARAFVSVWPTPAFNRALGLPPDAPSFLSTSQAMALVALALAALLALALRRVSQSSPQQAP